MREFSDLTPTLACAGYKRISREVLTELAKNGFWKRERARYFFENNPGEYQHIAQVYEILTNRIFNEGYDMKPAELASLAKQMSEFAKLKAQLVPADASDDVQYPDMDQAKDIARSTGESFSKDELGALAAVAVAEETPS